MIRGKIAQYYNQIRAGNENSAETLIQMSRIFQWEIGTGHRIELKMLLIEIKALLIKVKRFLIKARVVYLD